MGWVLIIWFQVLARGGGVDHVDFPTKEACEQAGKQYSAESSSLVFTTSGRYVCVSRGGEK